MSDFLFLTGQGKPYITAGVTSFLRNIVNAYNKDNPNEEPLPHIGTHILRHSFATRCNESGMNPKAVQQLLGHARATTTMDIYVSGSDPEWLRGEVNKLHRGE